jgi:hypothetical protein
MLACLDHRRGRDGRRAEYGVHADACPSTHKPLEVVRSRTRWRSTGLAVAVYADAQRGLSRQTAARVLDRVSATGARRVKVHGKRSSASQR